MSYRMRAFVALCATGIIAGVQAQAFPERTVRVISTFSGGLSPDTSMRVVADGLSRLWNQQVIVEPRPGGNGFIAIGAVKSAPANGYTLLLVSNSHMAINPSLFPKIPYDPEKDFATVSLVFRAPFFLLTSTSGPIKSVKDLVDLAKAQPGKVAYGSPQVGSPQHLGTALLESLTGTQMSHVPFKDGTQVFISVVNGDLAWAMGTIGSLQPIVKTGKGRIIAIAARSRLPSNPEVPTALESGGPAGFEVEAWNAIVAPRATPNEAVRRISTDMAAVLAQPGVQERFRSLGLVATSSTPEQLAQTVHSDIARYAELVKRTGAVAE